MTGQTEREITTFFENQVLFDSSKHGEELSRQLSNKVCMRIDNIGQLLGNDSQEADKSGEISKSSEEVESVHVSTNSVPNSVVDKEVVDKRATEKEATEKGGVKKEAATSEETLNFQKAWILSSVAQNYL